MNAEKVAAATENDDRRLGETIITSLSNSLWDLGFVIAYWVVYAAWQHVPFAK